uniref:Uncharacterized protein n=1 Tax=Ciona savignyi TaxID=51511 RepID=H2ZK33_CIOSA
TRWWYIGASLFVSNIGSEHFIGLAGSGASGGIGVGAWELNALMLLQLLGWIFIPVYIASGICTMPEYLEQRFGGKRLRIYLATLTLVLYCLTKISVNLYSGALFIQQSMGWHLYSSVTLLVCVTALLTVTGFISVDGYYGMKEKYMQATPNITYIQQKYNISFLYKTFTYNVLQGITDDEMPWLGFLLGQTPSSIWYWCTDQVIVQRALAARSLSHAQGGTLVAGFIKILPMYIMVMPGMISRVLFTSKFLMFNTFRLGISYEIACVPGEHCYQVCESESGCSNLAYPKLVLRVMPSGARGLMMAVMIAALMSDLDSIFNSASTIFTLDLWKRLRKSATNTELMIVGSKSVSRMWYSATFQSNCPEFCFIPLNFMSLACHDFFRLFIILLVGISIAWVPIILQFQGGQLFFYIQEVTNYISPPIAAIFLTAILWKGCTEKGAFYGGLVGSSLGLARLITIFIFKPPKCGEEDTRPSFLSSMHYMYFSAILFFLTICIAVLVSLFT